VVVPIEGNFDDALSLVREISQTRPVTLVNSLNPDRIEGQKTVAFEICDTLGDAPDFHAMPVGNAGNITAAWRGYREYHSLGHISRLPRLLGFQAAGAAPLATGRPFPEPETIATAIRIGRPASGAQALAARDESGGRIEAVTDEEIMAAYRLIARSEGIFCEPASAASVAGVIRAWAEGYFDTYPLTRRTVVCTLTGHGLKDPDAAMRELPALRPVPARMDRVLEAIELE
jgi:threonine synthase